jgi:tetratricopeptide (TPR) repeat protein
MRKEYDVFLSHNSCDKAQVEPIALWLRDVARLRVAFDRWILRPGLPWQPELERAISASAAAIVFHGPHGLGPWEDPEAQLFLDLATKRPIPVIPALLPGAPDDVEVKPFLSLRTWVDLRPQVTDEGLGQLYFGITGIAWAGRTHGAGRSPACHNLPFPSLGDGLKGRERELAGLEASLSGAAAVALTQPQAIHGLGGVGKTRLAVEYAWRSGARYRAAFFVGAKDPSTLHRNLARLAEPGLLGLNLPAGTGEDEVVRRVLGWLRENPSWLMILDNVDGPEAQAALQDFLPLSQGHVLVTTRLPTWPAGVVTRPVETLERPDAIALLLERSVGRRQRPDDIALADQLAQELGDLPLALELAAAYLDVQGPSFEQYLAAFKRDRAQVLAWFEPGATTYQTSVAQAWNQTLAHLSFPAQALLRLLAHLAPEPVAQDLVEAGTQTLRQALATLASEFRAVGLFDAGAKALQQAVALFGEQRSAETSEPRPDPRQALTELRSYSLIKRSGAMFTVHRLVQETVRSRIPVESSGEWVQLVVRWLDLYAPNENPDDVRTWPIWEPLLPHVVRVIELAEEHAVAPSAWILMNQLGALLYGKGLFRDAELRHQRALAISEQAFGIVHSSTCISLNNLALILRLSGRIREAADYQKRALEVAEIVFGARHPHVAACLNNLARVLDDTGQLEEAEQLQRRALQIDTDWFGCRDLTVARDLNNLALVLQATGRAGEAEKLMRRALDVRESSLGPDHPDVATVLGSLARLLQVKQWFEEAESLQRRAIAILTASLGPDHPRTRKASKDLSRLETERVAQG